MSDTTSLLIARVGPDGIVVPGSAHARVPWWSFGKTLLTACVLRLAEAGRLTLDEPPALPADVVTPAWTVRQLLQHTSGIGNYGALRAYHDAVAAGGTPWSDATLFGHVPPGELRFAPGDGWAYSNVGYLLLRRLVERLLERPLAEAIERLVLGPLGLRDSRLAVAADDLADLALPVPAGYDPGWVFHGLVIGPVDQAALALHRLWHGDLLAPATRQAMATPVPVGGPIAGRPWLRPGYGLGLMMGAMTEAAGDGAEAPCEVLGHSAGGPGSSGAVYTAAGGVPATAAAFTAGGSEAPAEFATLRAIRRLQSANQLAT